jgi:hypothetical protein
MAFTCAFGLGSAMSKNRVCLLDSPQVLRLSRGQWLGHVEITIRCARLNIVD